MPRNICICGMSPSSAQAPLDDPQWEYWGLAWDTARVQKAKVAFELHPPEQFKLYKREGPEQRYIDWLNALEMPIYMQQAYPEFPRSVAYPIDKIIPSNGELPVGGVSRDYFGSSIAYMIALAWLERVDRIGIWGVELSQADYHHQRPNLEYWIGRCEERGIPVDVIGDKGFLMKLVGHPAHNGKKYLRYAWIEA